MDKESIALILAIIAFIAVIIYILYSLNIIPIPAPIPTPTPSSTPIIQPGYGNILISYTNGSISLPQQAGTTITVPQNSSLNIIGQVNPNQQVFVAIYVIPQGLPVYYSTITSNSDGYFELIIPLNNLTSGQKYLMNFNLCYQYPSNCPFSNNYYFYFNVY